MTATESPHASIFVQPRRLTGEANRALTDWQKTACSMMQDSWRSLLGNQLTVSAERVDSAKAIRAVNQLPDPGYAAQMEVGPQKSCSIFCLSARMVQLLVCDMLGTPSEEWPEVRELTAIEISMVELLFGEIARAVSQSWPEVEPLECELVGVVERPMRRRFFPPDDVTVRTQITFGTAFGDDTGTWLLHREGLQSIGISDTPEDGSTTAAPQLRTLAEQLPMQLIVRLGDTTMKLSELDRLKVGDYLRLDQSVSHPLEMSIDGQVQWLGHPCRLGARQGFEIIASKKD